MPRKSSKNLSPNGGERWSFTVVQSKKHLEQIQEKQMFENTT